ncbi:uncharacterized protein LOC110835775 isoform X2 [Zootermopsis nevadensis]|uniref:uncharacterized protein LOC110835775 isoform X2 n=1 Tax=Zootermopsis nevadensis TaxID=136037 RepID=UPI000B8E9879|nr:uncharacterized protein LOC110835775 isoform X2 [Zootermopsis nevadensis]
MCFMFSKIISVLQCILYQCNTNLAQPHDVKPHLFVRESESVTAVRCSVEAVTLLAVSGFITILIVTILCYVRWHSRFLKSDSSEFSHTAKNLETVTAQQNEHQGTLPPQATFKRTIPSCRYAEVLKSILNEDKEEIFFPKKNDRK